MLKRLWRKGRRRGTRHLYFAYGSNLDGAQMRRRCPGARLVGAAVLDGYRLRFAGRSTAWGGAVATVIPMEGARVPGLLWELDARDLERLDGHEGHPLVYERHQLVVESDRGVRLDAFVYVKNEARQALPSEVYLDTIWRAYRRHGFDEQSLMRALKEEA